jgi:uncharacterized protein involved in exopolysaccharide biosynthesis
MNPRTPSEAPPPEVLLTLPAEENGHTPLWEANSHSPSFITALSYVWGRRRFVLKATLLGMIVSIVLVMIPAREYESTEKLMPPDKQSGGSLAMLASNVMGDRLGPMAGDILGVKTPSELLVGILRSRTVADRLINQFGLMKVYRENLLENAEKDLENSVTFDEDRKSGIITLVVRDRSPQRAAALAQGFATQLNAVMTELDSSDAHRERVFLEGRLVKAKVDLDTASRNLSQFSSKHTTLDITSQGKAMVDAAAVLQGQLMVAQSQLSAYGQIFTPNNVRVRALTAQIAELTKQLHNMVGTDESLASQDTESENNNGLIYPSIRELPLLGVPYFDLYRQAKIQEAVYEILTKQYEMAKVEEAKELPTVRVLDPGNVPERPAYPKRSDVAILGTFFFAFCAMVYLLASFRWSHMDDQHSVRLFLAEIRNGLLTDFASMRTGLQSSWIGRFLPRRDAGINNSSNTESR